MRLLSHEEPTARTEHICSACHGTIQPGETYTRQAIATYDGSVRTWKKCHQCVPGEDGFEASRRPEKCWGDTTEIWSYWSKKYVPRHGGAYWQPEANALRILSHYDYESHEESKTYESYLIPLVGMTRWREVPDE